MNHMIDLPQRSSRRRVVLLIGATSLLLGACGDDGGDAASAAPAPTTVPAPAVLAVTMSDFHYGDLPDAVPAGTRITVSNDSPSELHELVAVRLPDDEDRSAAEIVADDLGALFAAVEPTAVLLAPPGGAQIAAVGDGTLEAPGRYLVVCVIPTGADPTEYLEAAATSDGPPEVAGGPPHVAHGMFAELTVTG